MNIIKENVSIIEEKILKPIHTDQEIEPELASAIKMAIRKRITVTPIVVNWLSALYLTSSNSISC